MNAAIMLVEALKATGGDTDPAGARDAMEGMTFRVRRAKSTSGQRTT